MGQRLDRRPVDGGADHNLTPTGEPITLGALQVANPVHILYALQ